MFSTFLWPAALSSGQRRWRFPPFGTLPGAAFLPDPSTVSLDSYIFGSPLRRLRSCLRRLFHGIQNTTAQAQAPAAPLLRCRLSTFSFSFTVVVWRSPGQPLLCRLTIRPPHALPSRGALRQGIRLPAWTASVAVFPLLSSTYSSQLFPFLTSLWPAALRGSLALTPAGRYPLRHICLYSRGGCLWLAR